MSTSPSAAVPRLFYHPAYWCHSCDMSIGLPPSPTPSALLCPHCHRDSLEQMDTDSPANRNPNLTPSDDNFLLNSPYLHRLIHHLTAADAPHPRPAPAPRSSIDSLPDAPVADPTALCPVCKDPLVSVAKLMPCNHAYHPDCIVPWLEINNSCPVCRFRLPPAPADGMGYLGIEELVDNDDDEGDLFGFRNTLRHIARRQRWNEEDEAGNVGGSGSEGNLFSPTQIGEVGREGGGGVLERQNSVETVSSWPRWQVEERGGGGNDDDGGGDGLTRS